MPQSMKVFEFDGAEFDGPGAGEKRLALAILEDAVGCLLQKLGRRRDRPRLRRRAVSWIASRDTSWIHSFVSVCDTLSIDADCLRGALLKETPAIAATIGDPRRYTRISPMQVDEIKELIRGGALLAVVADRFNVSRTRITKIAFRELRQARRRRNKDIRYLQKDGWSLGQLAERFRLSKTHIDRLCREKDNEYSLSSDRRAG